MYYFGCYDWKGISLLTNIAHRINSRTALDVGANVGNHAIFISEYCEKLYSFEPNNRPSKIFREAISSSTNKNIHLLEFGLGASNETLPFYDFKGNYGRSSFVYDASQVGLFESKEFEVRIGDSVVKDLELSDIDLIKIDVEGFEKEVLVGLQETIRDQQPIIDFEYNQQTRKKCRISQG
jgi:FkbM family methyltransferase